MGWEPGWIVLQKSFTPLGGERHVSRILIPAPSAECGSGCGTNGPGACSCKRLAGYRKAGWTDVTDSITREEFAAITKPDRFAGT